MVLHTISRLRRPVLTLAAGMLLGTAALFGGHGVTSASAAGVHKGPPPATSPAPSPGLVHPDSITWD